jgi:hypothetical protein
MTVAVAHTTEGTSLDPQHEKLNPVQQIMAIATGYVPSSALHVALALNLADHIAGGAASTADLARATGANEDALYRVLRLLASLGVFTEVGPRRFGLTGASELLRKDVPGSMRGMALFLPDPLHFRVYANLMGPS